MTSAVPASPGVPAAPGDPPSDAPLVIVTTSPRVAPGLLPLHVWNLLRARQVAAGPGHPQVDALAAEGIVVRVVPDATLDDVRALSPVAWLAAPGDHPTLRQGSVAGQPNAAVLVGSADLPGARLLDAVAVMDRLRSPGGCPWDAEQTHTSLMPYLLEEAYEAYQTLEDGDPDALRDELGDVLLQVLFHARIAAEDAGWSIDDVAEGLVDKLVRRHPHVFGAVSVEGAEQVQANWDAIKAAEAGGGSTVARVPLALPALSLAAKVQKRAAKAGLPAGAVVAGLDSAAPAGALAAAAAALPFASDADRAAGELLWTAVAVCRSVGVDPEQALRGAARGHRDRLAEQETRTAAGSGGGAPSSLAAADLS